LFSSPAGGVSLTVSGSSNKTSEKGQKV